MVVWQSTASSEKFSVLKETLVISWHRFSRLCKFCSICTQEDWFIGLIPLLKLILERRWRNEIPLLRSRRPCLQKDFFFVSKLSQTDMSCFISPFKVL